MTAALPRSLSICVFCASSKGLPAEHHDAARRLGELIAGRGHRLVYGGGNAGLMGEVARAVSAGGGQVYGVIPEALIRREQAYEPATELVVTQTMRERKAAMDDAADAFIALPGGFGTLEELVEVITLRQLGINTRPVIVVDVAGYYRPFIALAREMVDQGFAPAGEGDLFEVAATPEEAIELAEAPHLPRETAPVETAVESWESGSR